MRILGVIDLLGGRAVHARGGDRQTYAPVASVQGDAVALARRYLDAGVSELYVADLNAIVGDDPQDALVGAIASLDAPVWLDAGITSVEGARRSLALGAARIIVGLETLASFDALRTIAEYVGVNRTVFSLDLRDGELIARPELVADLTSTNLAAPVAACQGAVHAGAGAIIVLDLARVGTGVGINLRLFRDVRSVAQDVLLLAGGGIRGSEDLNQLAATGCDGALIATAFHNGSLGAAQLQKLFQARERRHGVPLDSVSR